VPPNATSKDDETALFDQMVARAKEMRERREYPEEGKLLGKAILLGSQQFGRDAPEVVKLIIEHAWCFHHQKTFDMAETLFLHALGRALLAERPSRSLMMLASRELRSYYEQTKQTFLERRFAILGQLVEQSPNVAKLTADEFLGPGASAEERLIYEELKRAIAALKSETAQRMVLRAHYLAPFFVDRGDTQSGRKLYQKELTLLGESNPILHCVILAGIGKSYYNEGNSFEARHIFEQEMQIQEKQSPKQRIYRDILLNDFIAVAVSEGEFANALRSGKEFLTLRIDRYGAESLEVSQALSIIADIQWISKDKDADSTLDRAQEILEKQLSKGLTEDNEGLASMVYSRIIGILQNQSEHRRMLRLHERFTEAVKAGLVNAKGDNVPAYLAGIDSALPAQIYLEAGDLVSAQRLITLALNASEPYKIDQKLQRDHLQDLSTLLFLEVATSGQSILEMSRSEILWRLEEALVEKTPVVEAKLETYDRVALATKLDIKQEACRHYQQLAEVAFESGAFANAKERLAMAEDHARELELKPPLIRILAAKIAVKEGRFDDAITELTPVFTTYPLSAGDGAMVRRVCDAGLMLAELLHARGKSDEAQKAMRRLEVLANASLVAYSEVISLEQLAGFSGMTSLPSIAVASRDKEQIANICLGIKGRLLASARGARTIAGSDKLTAQREARRKLQTLLTSVRLSDDAESASSISASLELEKATRVLEHATSAGNKLVEMDLDWHKVQHTLQENECFIDYVKYRKFDLERCAYSSAYGAIVLLREGAPHWVPLPAASGGRTLDELVSSTRGLIQRPPAGDSEDQIIANLKELHALVWEPIKPFLGDGKTRTIRIRTDGALDHLPFATLVCKKGLLLRLLCEDYPHIVFSSTAIRPTDTLPLSGSMLVVAGPTDRSSGDSVAAIQEQEAATVESLARQHSFRVLPTVKRNEATEDHVAEVIARQRPSIVHFSCHGYSRAEYGQWNSQFMGATGLRLAPQPGAPTALAQDGDSLSPLDGWWSWREVSQTDMQEVRLAALCACRSGLGSVSFGEGTIGLEWGLRLAGVKNVLLTQWSIDDNVHTVRFVERFYQNLLMEEGPRQEASWKTQVELLPAAIAEEGFQDAVRRYAGFRLTTGD
jgi:CHAT domain-containing protein